MTRSPLRSILVCASETVLAILVGLGAVITYPAPASATPNDPVVIDTAPGPAGITVGAPWLVESGGGTAWMYGTSSTGYGTLVTYKPATQSWTTSALMASETGVVGSAYSPSANLAAFTATRSGLGNRIVFVNLATGAKTVSKQMTTVQTNLRALAFDSSGANLWVATNDTPSLMIKIASATGNEVTYTALGSWLKDPTSMVPFGSQMVLSFATSPVKIASYSTTTPGVTTTVTLPATIPTLVDPVVVGGTAYYGSDSTPGRITAVDLATLTVVGSLELAAGETGAHAMSIDASTDTLYATTTTGTGTRLVVATASSLTRRGSAELGPGTTALGTLRVGHRVSVGFAGARGVTTLSVAPVPDAPSGLTVDERDSELAVSWSAPSSVENLTGYTVTVTGGGASTICTTVTTSCDVTGLRNGTNYSVGVAAQSIAGTSTSATATGSPRTRPFAPRGITVTRGNRALAVEWTAGDDGGRPILGYTATATPGGATCATTGATRCTIDGLTNGTAHTVWVTARTSVGTSDASAASDPVIPATTPAAPGSLSVARGNAILDVAWTEPIDDGGLSVTGFAVTTDPVSDGCVTAVYSCTLSGLTNGTAYRVSISARNDVGTGEPITFANLVTPATTPTAVRGIVAQRGDRSVHLDWVPPVDDGGDSVSGYRVTDRATGTLVCSTTDVFCSIEQLINGAEYRFDVVAVNAIGASPVSSSPAIVPATRPAPAAAPAPTRGDRSVSVRWVEPPRSAGVPVLKYSVVDADGTERCVTTVTSCIISDLVNGRQYRFAVIAVNEVGTSDPSALSAIVTPATVPSSPIGATTTSGNGVGTAAWTVDPDDGGDPVVEFIVRLWWEGLVVREFSTTTTDVAVDGLTNGQVYRVTVSARNGVGESTPMLVGVVSPTAPPVVEPPITEPPTPEPPIVEPPVVDPPVVDPPVVDPPVVPPKYLVPASPYSVTALSQKRRTIVLGWGAPPDGGSPIIDYRIEASSHLQSGFIPVADSVSAATVAQVRKPSSTRWYVRVSAVNAIGVSTPSTVVRIRVR